SNHTVRNGSVVGFTNGIDIEGDGNLLEEIHVRGNMSGILISDGVARRNTANLNGVGIIAFRSTVSENVVNSNEGNGLQIIDRGLFGSNTLVGNGGPPVFNNGSVSQNNNSCNGAGC